MQLSELLASNGIMTTDFYRVGKSRRQIIRSEQNNDKKNHPVVINLRRFSQCSNLHP